MPGDLEIGELTQPWRTLKRVITPEGPLELRQRGERDFLITVGGRTLMTSTAHRSEDELARSACARIAGTRNARVLVGGLGMGFTLRAALDGLPGDARVIVAELNPVVAEWCRGPLGPLTGDALADPRVSLVIGDVAKVIAAHARRPSGERFDAIILDLYEGPNPTAIPTRDPLYGPGALATTHDALGPGGVLAVWTETRSPAFERLLAVAGFIVDTQRGGRGAAIHWIHLGVRSGT